MVTVEGWQPLCQSLIRVDGSGRQNRKFLRKFVPMYQPPKQRSIPENITCLPPSRSPDHNDTTTLPSLPIQKPTPIPPEDQTSPATPTSTGEIGGLRLLCQSGPICLGEDQFDSGSSHDHQPVVGVMAWCVRSISLVVVCAGVLTPLLAGLGILSKLAVFPRQDGDEVFHWPSEQTHGW